MVMRRRSKEEDGAAAVEFAIVAVLLFMIVFGMIEFGLWIAQYESYTSAAREGARVAATKSDVNGDGSFTNADIVTAVQQAATPYTISPGTPSADKTCSDATLGQLVTVSWSQNFNIPNVFALLPILPGNRTIKGAFRCEAAG
jgi:Flp pilus assembly protein TadG